MVGIMDMGNMHIEKSTKKMVFFKAPIRRYQLITISIVFYNAPCVAIDWSITPNLQVQEIFSDNIKLSSKNQSSAFVTSVSPGVSVIGRSARNMLNLNYNMQNLYNANGDNNISIFNQLNFNSQHTLLSERFFLNTSSSISQQNISNTQIANDNISGNGNRTNVSTVQLSPYWTPHFGSFADGMFRIDFNTITSSANSANTFVNNNNQQSNAFSDTVTLGETIQLNSGNDFKRVAWNAALQNTKNYRDGGQDVTFRNYHGTVRTFINTDFNLFATAGMSDNNFQTVTDSNKNGFYYTVGGQWKPSNNYSIEVGGGNNSHVTVYISPMQRLNWTTTYRNNSIGLNTGSTWQTNLNYQAKNSTWYVSHTNDTVTTQSIFANQKYLTGNTSGNTSSGGDSSSGNIFGPNGSTTYFPNQTDDVYVRKTWNLGVTYMTGKSTIGGNAFNEKRTSQLFGNTETVQGVTASWNWQFAPKTSAYIYPVWQQIDRDTTIAKDNRYDVTLGMSRLITNSLTGKLEFRHLNQSSDIETNNYQENRATASLFMRF
ncbi:MAG: TIGR03016 family PEP-CTERM system-associated outer membrane protein [Methylococcales bacterium]